MAKRASALVKLPPAQRTPVFVGPVLGALVGCLLGAVLLHRTRLNFFWASRAKNVPARVWIAQAPLQEQLAFIRSLPRAAERGSFPATLGSSGDPVWVEDLLAYLSEKGHTGKTFELRFPNVTRALALLGEPGQKALRDLSLREEVDAELRALATKLAGGTK
jgi:hypothetical protein